MTVWVQTGSYVLIALSEIFASITGLEYAFTKAPKNMRSLIMSVFLFTSAISYALGQAFVGKSLSIILSFISYDIKKFSKSVKNMFVSSFR